MFNSNSEKHLSTLHYWHARENCWHLMLLRYSFNPFVPSATTQHFMAAYFIMSINAILFLNVLGILTSELLWKMLKEGKRILRSAIFLNQKTHKTENINQLLSKLSENDLLIYQWVKQPVIISDKMIFFSVH